MNAITTKGTQTFMGKDIPVVLGGFGKGKKCISDKTIAEIHGMEVKNVRSRISDNITRFQEGIDFIDLKQRACQTATLELLKSIGYSQQSIVQAAHIYILSERGYAKLIKIMDTDLAWEIHDRLIDEYFELREEKKTAAAKKNLSAVNMMVKNITSVYTKAGVDPVYIALTVSNLYRDEADVKVTLPIEADTPKLYDSTEMARELGMQSSTGKPHALAVSAILQKINISADEVVRTPFTRNGHSDVTIQYKPSVLESVKAWLRDYGYPAGISYTDASGHVKTCMVYYHMQVQEV